MNSYNQMNKIISEMPKHFEIAEKTRIHNAPERSKNIKNIIICGMGGSALGGLFLKSIFDKPRPLTAEFHTARQNNKGDNSEPNTQDISKERGKLPVIIHRDYGLPKEAGKNSLIICNSYSGGTEETLSSYLDAKKRKLKIYSIAGGGKLAELCGKNKTPWLELPIKNIPPRTSVFLQLAAIAKILENEKLGGAAMLNNFKKAAGKINAKTSEKSAKNLAAKIAGKIILVYSDGRLSPFAYHLKISLNENAKIHAFTNVIPECGHNEIAGFSRHSKKAGNFAVIFLSDGKEHPRNGKKIRALSDLIKKSGYSVYGAKVKGKNNFEKILNSTLFNNWLSFYSAKRLKEDVIATALIDELKKK